jgi:hypothetical protein
MTIETGALEQAYAIKETAFGVVPADALAATDAIRHLELSVSGKLNREPSPEKRGTPDEAQSLPRRFTAQWNLSNMLWEPSGTIGTPSNAAKFLKGAMGAEHDIAAGLVTTVAAMPAPSATGCTLTSGAGLQVGDVMVFTTGAGAKREVTRLKTVAGAAVTYDALTAAPDAPGAAVSGCNFSLANLVSDSFAIYKYYNAGNFKQAVYGAVADQFTVSFDGTKEVMLAIQGPAANYADSSTGGGTVQAKPGAHTTVGSPVGGMIGNFHVDGNVFLVIGAKFTVNNNLELRNKELGTSFASGIAGRQNKRKINVQITCFLEDTRLLGYARSVQKGVLRCLVGNVNGGMLAAVAPSVEFEIPEIGNEIGPKEITIPGVCYATNGNDQLFLGEL